MNIHGVLVREVRELHDGELQMADSLPFLRSKAQGPELAGALDDMALGHQERLDRLKELSAALGFRPTGESFRLFRGFLQDATNRLRSMWSAVGTDMYVANTALMATQLEIVGFETVAEMVVVLKKPQAQGLIQEALEEKYARCEALRNAVVASLRPDNTPATPGVTLL